MEWNRFSIYAKRVSETENIQNYQSNQEEEQCFKKPGGERKGAKIARFP